MVYRVMVLLSTRVICPYLYFLKAREFYLMMLFPCEYLFLKKCVSYRHLNSEKHLIKYRVSLLWFFLLLSNLLLHLFIFKTFRCIRVKRFYTNTLLGFFLPCLRQNLPWKHFICHYLALKTWRKYKPLPNL